MPERPSLLAFLASVVAVLQGDITLTATVAAANIGVNIRKSPDVPAIEVGLDGGNVDRDIKETQRLRVTIYGTNSAAQILQVADRISALLTPSNLTDENTNPPTIVAFLRKTRNVVLPSDHFGHQIELAFDCKLTT